MKKKFQNCQESEKSPLIPLFQRGKFGILYRNQIKKALLPLKKGGREGFLGKPFQMAKQKKIEIMKIHQSGLVNHSFSRSVDLNVP